MKNKFKNYLKLGILLFGISFTLSSCEKDDALNVNTSKKETLRIENISLSNFKNKKAVVQTINKLTANDNEKLNRAVYDSENDFYINTDEVILIEKDGFHWLTFSIKRNSDSTDLENLVLRQNTANNTYLAYLAKYAISENEINTIRNGGKVNDIEYKVTFKPLTSFNSDIFSRDRIIHQRPDGSCFSYGTTIYGDNDEVIGMTEIPVECPEYLTSDTGDGNDGGGGGTTDNTPDDGCGTCPDYEGIPFDNTDTGANTVVTSPSGTASGDTTATETDNNSENTECLTSDIDGNCLSILTTPKPEPEDPHITSLNFISKIPKIKTELNRLRTGMNYSTIEDGKQYTYTGSNINDISLLLDDNFHPVSPEKKFEDKLKFPSLTNNTVYGAHYHPGVIPNGSPSGTNKYISPVPSGTDIAEHIVMVKKYAENNPSEEGQINQVTNFVVSQGYTFAIRTNNESEILGLTDDFTKKAKKEKIGEKIIEKIKANCSPSNSSCHIQPFMEFLNTNYPALSLYQAVFNNSGEIINWIKL
ncbi:MAG: hypothetical protein ACPG45_10315 [Flavobacteriaceae bacterium]